MINGTINKIDDIAYYQPDKFIYYKALLDHAATYVTERTGINFNTTDASATELLAFARYFQVAEDSGFYVVINLDKQKLIQQMSEICTVYPGTTLFILDEHDVLATNSTNIGEVFNETIRQQLTEKNFFQSDGYIYSISSFKKIGISCLAVTIIDEITGSIQTLNLKLFLLIPILLLLALSLSVAIALRIYKPIGNLVQFVDPVLVPNIPADEIEFIKKQFQTITEKNADTASKLQQARPLIVKNFISSLMHGAVPMEKLQESLAFYNISFPYRYLAVMLIEIDEESIRDAVSMVKLSGLVTLCVNEILDKVPSLSHHFMELDNNKICVLLNFNLSQKITEKPYYHLCDDIKNEIFEQYGVVTTISCGERITNPAEIPQAYKTATFALEKKHIYGKGEIIFYNDLIALGEGDQHTYFPSKPENKLIASIRQNNYQGAVEAISTIYAEIQTRPYLNQCHIQFIALRVVFDIVKSLNLDVSAQFHEEFQNYMTMVLSDHVLLDECLTSLRRFCDQIITTRLEKTNRHNITLVNQIVDYINTHFTAEITVENVSDNLGVSSAHLTRIFRQQKGMTIQNYILSKKMDIAKQLIITTKLTIEEIAVQLGYTTVGGFNRAFKLHTGKSPSQYRSELS